MAVTVGETLYETLIQFEGTTYVLGEAKFLVHKVFQDYFSLRKEDGSYYFIRYDHVKLIKTNPKGTAIEWIVFDDNRQLPG